MIYGEGRVFRGAIFKASDETATGYDDTDHEPERERNVLYVSKGERRQSQGVLLVFFPPVKRRSMA